MPSADRERRRPRYLATERTARARLAAKHREEDIRAAVLPVPSMNPYRDPDGRDIDVDDVGRTL